MMLSMKSSYGSIEGNVSMLSKHWKTCSHINLEFHLDMGARHRSVTLTQGLGLRLEVIYGLGEHRDGLEVRIQNRGLVPKVRG